MPRIRSIGYKLMALNLLILASAMSLHAQYKIEPMSADIDSYEDMWDMEITNYASNTQNITIELETRSNNTIVYQARSGYVVLNASINQINSAIVQPIQVLVEQELQDLSLIHI